MVCDLNQSFALLIMFGFACAVASGKMQAFVKLFYARADAPMPGFGISPSLKKMRSAGSSLSRLLLLSNCRWKEALEKQFGLGPVLWAAVVFSLGNGVLGSLIK